MHSEWIHSLYPFTVAELVAPNRRGLEDTLPKTRLSRTSAIVCKQKRERERRERERESEMQTHYDQLGKHLICNSSVDKIFLIQKFARAKDSPSGGRETKRGRGRGSKKK